MNRDVYDKIYKLKDEHFLYFYKRQLFDRFATFKRSNKKRTILDIGCGPNTMLEFLLNYGKTYGLDYSNIALDYSKKVHGVKTIQGDVNYLPIRHQSVDFAVCSDILTQRTVSMNEKKVLKSVHAIMKENGCLFITDSAFPILASNHDREAGVNNRLSVSGLEKNLKEAGFNVEKISYIFFFIFPFVFAIRWTKFVLNIFFKKKSSHDLFSVYPPVNTVLKWLISVELFLLRYIKFPFGVMVFAVARKKG